MKLSLIVAMGQNREIGKNNDLMWHLPTDMKFFKDTTKGRTVIMGRKNYESIPEKWRPLPHRTNIVVSRNSNFEAPECYVVASISEAASIAKSLGETEAFIIGGAQIYELALQKLPMDVMYITHVDKAFPDADAFFPEVNLDEWNAEEVFSNEANDTDNISFSVIKYTKRRY